MVASIGYATSLTTRSNPSVSILPGVAILRTGLPGVFRKPVIGSQDGFRILGISDFGEDFGDIHNSEYWQAKKSPISSQDHPAHPARRFATRIASRGDLQVNIPHDPHRNAASRQRIIPRLQTGHGYPRLPGFRSHEFGELWRSSGLKIT
jgi:hypothetical protein